MTQQTSIAIPEQGGTIVKDGAFEGMPFDVYASVPAINGSSIVHMRRSPMYYRHMKDNPEPATPAMILGTATHRLILEPTRVGDFAIWGLKEEEKVRRGKVWDAFQEANLGKMVVTENEAAAMVGMAVAARKNLPIRKYADAKGPTEVSLFWHDPESGRRFKCRIDKWIPSKRTVFDLKSTVSCDPYRFGAQSYKLAYHIKMAIQWMGVKAVFGVDPFLKLGAVESRAPHESAVYRITKDTLLQGLEDLAPLLSRLTDCEASGKWPAAMEEESDLQLPTWATSTDDTSEAFAIDGLELGE